MVAGGLDPSGQSAAAFESSHVIALPAMERDWEGGERFEGSFGIHAMRGVGFLGEGVSG